MATGMLLIASVVQAQTGQEVKNHAAHAGHEHAHDHAAHQQAAKPEALPEQTANAKPAGPHGGIMQQVGQFQIESILEPGGIRVFAYDQQGQPVELKGARGLATVKIEELIGDIEFFGQRVEGHEVREQQVHARVDREAVNVGGAHTSTDLGLGLEDSDRMALLLQPERTAEAGNSSADDGNLHEHSSRSLWARR